MKFFIGLALLVFTPFVAAQITQGWAQIAKFEDFFTYYPKLVQEMMYGVEEMGWCNFKLFDQTMLVNETIYDTQYVGQVNFTNGFLVTIQHLDLNNVNQAFMQGIASFTNTGSMLGILKFHNAVIGYDVDADFGELGIHKMTGTFEHRDIEFQVRVVLNLNTTEITPTVRLIGLQGNGQMHFLPETAIGEVISRHYKGATNWNAVVTWASIMTRFLREAIDRIGFPKVCFNCISVAN